MEEKTIEGMVREEKQKKAKVNVEMASKPTESKKSLAGEKGDVVKNIESDIKNIEKSLRTSTSAEVELGFVGQLKGLIEKLKSGQLDLVTAQNLLKNINSLKSKVSTDLKQTNEMIKTTKEMDNRIKELYKLLKEKCDNEFDKKEEQRDRDIEELENLLRALEKKKKALNSVMGSLIKEQKALKSIKKGIDGVQVAVERQAPSLKKPVGINKFLVSITDGIATLSQKSVKVNLPKDIENRVSLNNKDKNGVKDIENINEGILKILAKDGDEEKVKRILGADRLKQDLTKPIDTVKEEKRTTIERKTNKEHRLDMVQKQGIIKPYKNKNNMNKMYAPTIEKTQKHNRNKGINKKVGGKGRN